MIQFWLVHFRISFEFHIFTPPPSRPVIWSLAMSRRETGNQFVKFSWISQQGKVNEPHFSTCWTCNFLIPDFLSACILRRSKSWKEFPLRFLIFWLHLTKERTWVEVEKTGKLEYRFKFKENGGKWDQSNQHLRHTFPISIVCHSRTPRN